MKRVPIVTTKRCSVTHTISLTGETILALLKRDGVPVPDGAEVTFTVPSGGDYSGDDVHVNDDSPVTVCWETVERK